MATNNDRDFIEQTRSSFVDLDETRNIIQTLLSDLKEDAFKELFQAVQTLVSGLNIYNLDSFDPWNEKKFSEDYYAVHFEAIDLNYSYGKNTIYIGFGIDNTMQKNILGFWFKPDSESYFHFWLKVFEQLKDSGMQSIELDSIGDCYLQHEARNRVFN